MNISKKLIYMCATVLTAVLSVGCSQSESKDDPNDPGFEEGIPTEVRINLTVRSGNLTRADGRPEDPNAPVEFIYNWWLAFVDTKGNVTVQKRNSVSDTGFELESFTCIVPSGTYDIYAFANIAYSDQNLSDFVDGLASARKNATSKDAALTAIKEAMNSIRLNASFEADDMTWPKTSNIPMTGYLLGAQVRNTVEETFSIEVIRAVAKVEFCFDNPNEENITLEELKLSPVTTSALTLFPDYSVIGQKKNEMLKELSKGELTFNNLSELTIEYAGYSLGGFHFYCKETLPEKDGFDIELKVLRGGTEKTYTYQTKTITYINRNDWIRIPITFSDWMIYWKLRAYPPIGGYPPEFDQNEDGTTLSATVTTGGEFELYPSLIMNGSNDFTSNVDWSKDVTLTVLEGSDDIFIKTPALEPDPDNLNAKIIAGELDPRKTGTAKVKIEFYLEESTGITSILTCIFTINRPNSANG